jgi:hypothetical protein
VLANARAMDAVMLLFSFVRHYSRYPFAYTAGVKLSRSDMLNPYIAATSQMAGRCVAAQQSLAHKVLLLLSDHTAKPTPFDDAHFGLTTEVVSDPLSTYTPEKYQSSAPVPSLPCRGNRSTPKCQSAPLLDVLAENGPAVLTSVLLPVECQKVTCWEPKF